MSERKDRHQYKTRTCLHLTEEQLQSLEILLPFLSGFQAKARYLLEIMVEIAQSGTRNRIAPKGKAYGEPIAVYVRVPKTTYQKTKQLAGENCLSVGAYSTQLVFAGIEALENGDWCAEDYSKEELMRLIRRELEEQSRLKDFRQGLKLIWRALSGR